MALRKIPETDKTPEHSEFKTEAALERAILLKNGTVLCEHRCYGRSSFFLTVYSLNGEKIAKSANYFGGKPFLLPLSPTQFLCNSHESIHLLKINENKIESKNERRISYIGKMVISQDGKQLFVQTNSGYSFLDNESFDELHSVKSDSPDWNMLPSGKLVKFFRDTETCYKIAVLSSYSDKELKKLYECPYRVDSNHFGLDNVVINENLVIYKIGRRFLPGIEEEGSGNYFVDEYTIHHLEKKKSSYLVCHDFVWTKIENELTLICKHFFSKENKKTNEWIVLNNETLEITSIDLGFTHDGPYCTSLSYEAGVLIATFENSDKLHIVKLLQKLHALSDSLPTFSLDVVGLVADYWGYPSTLFKKVLKIEPEAPIPILPQEAPSIRS